MAGVIVAVTETQYKKAESVFSAAGDLRCVAAPGKEAELVRAIRESGARHAVVGAEVYRDGLYDALPRGGVLARFGVGYDSIDTAKATASGLLCTNTPGVLDQSVAEHTLLLIGAAARHLVPMASGMREAAWVARTGSELRGKTLVVVGAGAIGRAVARIAAFGYGMRVLGEDVNAGGRIEGFTSIGDNLEAVVAEADFVSLHVPASPSTAHFINADRLWKFPAHAWLINTARGAVVDELALYDALAERRIAGAALDVFEREPYQPVDSARDLRKLPNVILTPHVASNTAEANRRIGERALQNIRLAEAGDFEHMDLVNREVLDVGVRLLS